MKQCHTQGRENSRELCVLPPLLGERAGGEGERSSNPIFGVVPRFPSLIRGGEVERRGARARPISFRCPVAGAREKFQIFERLFSWTFFS